jgi:hypothetical protein
MFTCEKITYTVKQFWQNWYAPDDSCVRPKHVTKRYIWDKNNCIWDCNTYCHMLVTNTGFGFVIGFIEHL